MKRYITDEIYCNSDIERSTALTTAEKRFFKKLSGMIPENEYMKIEDELNSVFILMEKEAFYYGFIEGIRFLIKCM